MQGAHRAGHVPLLLLERLSAEGNLMSEPGKVASAWKIPEVQDFYRELAILIQSAGVETVVKPTRSELT